VTAIDDPGRRRVTNGTAGRTGSRRGWVRIALHLFPSTWQARFGAEFGALLDQTPPTPGVLFDVLVAAVDAHVHPTGPRRRWPLMIERLRMSELVVFASWVVFVVAGLAFQRMTEGAPFNRVATDHPAVGWAYAAIIAGAVLSLAAIVVAGVPIALAIARASLAAGRWRQIALLAVPPVSLAVWVGLTLVLLSLGDPPAGDPWRVIAFLGWVGVFVLAAIVSTIAVSAAALDADVDASLYRRAATPAVAASGAMALALVSVVAWGIAVALTSPADFWGFEGILGISTPLTWLGLVVVMAGATVVAARAAIRARRDLAR
jgi:hypothetical protein